MLAIYRTFASVNITGRFDEELVGVLPTSVRFICHNGKLPSFLFFCRVWLWFLVCPARFAFGPVTEGALWFWKTPYNAFNPLIPLSVTDF